jgi:hypothetical protein
VVDCLAAKSVVLNECIAFVRSHIVNSGMLSPSWQYDAQVEVTWCKYSQTLWMNCLLQAFCEMRPEKKKGMELVKFGKVSKNRVLPKKSHISL